MDTLDELGRTGDPLLRHRDRRDHGPRRVSISTSARPSPASASSGIAVGFGAQSLVRDYLNGALILIENQYSKGDVVSIAGVSGAVEDFSLRRTTLRDLDGVVHTVPNGEIKVASNRTRTWARINQNVMVAFGTDIDKAIQVVEELGKQMAADPIWKRRILEPPRVERVESIDERGVTLKILGHGPGVRAVGRRRRVPEAAPRGVREERDPPAAAAAGLRRPPRSERDRGRPSRSGPPHSRTTSPTSSLVGRAPTGSA